MLLKKSCLLSNCGGVRHCCGFYSCFITGNDAPPCSQPYCLLQPNHSYCMLLLLHRKSVQLAKHEGTLILSQSLPVTVVTTVASQNHRDWDLELGDSPPPLRSYTVWHAWYGQKLNSSGLCLCESICDPVCVRYSSQP